MRDIAMIGAFPPPLHGMAAVNLAMKDFILSKGGQAEVFDLSPSALSRSWFVRLKRAARVAKRLWRFGSYLANRRRASSVYMSVSGGYGQVFEIPFILLSRFWGASIVLHHHSFLYIDRPRFLTRVLVYCAGAGTMHVVLCGKMALKLRSSYPAVGQTFVASNAGFFPLDQANYRIRSGVKMIGFLGNIEADKGILEFLDVLEQLDKSDEIAAVIAGPFFNRETERLVRNRIECLPNVRYVGPKYGEEKRVFFETIDVLLYPTRNDAEPLTVLEAMSHGVPLIARSKGCIEEMVGEHAGAVFESQQDYVSAAVAQLRHWAACPREFENKSRGAGARYKQMHETSQRSLAQLYELLTVCAN